MNFQCLASVLNHYLKNPLTPISTHTFFRLIPTHFLKLIIVKSEFHKRSQHFPFGHYFIN